MHLDSSDKEAAALTRADITGERSLPVLGADRHPKGDPREGPGGDLAEGAGGLRTPGFLINSSRVAIADFLSIIAVSKVFNVCEFSGGEPRNRTLPDIVVANGCGKAGNPRLSLATASVLGDICCAGGPKAGPWPSSAPESGECRMNGPPAPVDLTKSFLALGRDGKAVVLAASRPPSHVDGFTIGAPRMRRNPPHAGEVHPDGDEILYLISGGVDVILEEADSDTSSTLDIPSCAPTCTKKKSGPFNAET